MILAVTVFSDGTLSSPRTVRLRKVDAWVPAIRGYEFEFAEGLSPKAQENLDHAYRFTLDWLNL